MPGYIYVCDVSDVSSDVTLTLTTGVSGQRFGVKVLGLDTHDIHVVAAEGSSQDIESPQVGATPGSIPMHTGEYREWLLDASAGTWLLVGALGGFAGG